MRKIYLITSIAALLFHYCCSGQHAAMLRPTKLVSIPFYYDANDEYSMVVRSTPTVVTVTNPAGDVVFTNKNFNIFKWGWDKPVLLLKYTGRYKVHVKFYADSLSPKEFIEHFEIKGDELMVELHINLVLLVNQENDIILNKFYGNKFNVRLKHLSKPKAQFDTSKVILPSYEWTNTCDSVLFGIHRQYSSWSTIGYVRNWNFAYLQLQKFNDSQWQKMDCDDLILEAELKKRQTGKALHDTAFVCESKQSNPKGKYRIFLEYGINDEIVRHTPEHGKFEESFYYEPHIYQVTDEFTLGQ